MFALPIVLAYGSNDFIGLDDHKEPNHECFIELDKSQSAYKMQSVLT